MTKFYCDRCKKVTKEEDTDWIEISPHYRKGEGSWATTVQICEDCKKELSKFLKIKIK